MDGLVSADGTIRVQLLNDYVPTRGEQFTILAATDGIEGDFTVDDSQTPEIRWSLTHLADAVILTAEVVGIVFTDGFETR